MLMMAAFRADRLREARTMRGFTQDELAERIHIGMAGINRYENGKTAPAPDILAQLAIALEVSTDWLLGLTDNPQGNLTTAELTPAEWQALSAFRRANLEDLVRAFIEDRGHQPGDDDELPPAE